MTARALQVLPSQQAAAIHSRSAPGAAWLLSRASRIEGESGNAAPERRIAELEALVGELDAYTGSVAHDLREHHGGRVWADARPGEGATFYFTLSPR